MIKLQIIGHIGKDCTVNSVNGKSVINFNVAHTEKWKDAQGVAMEKTTWVQCSFWTERPTIASYLIKGKQVFVEGTPETDWFNSAKDGFTAILKCRVRDVQLLGSAGGNNQARPPAGQQNTGNAGTGSPYDNNGTPPPEDDLPF